MSRTNAATSFDPAHTGTSSAAKDYRQARVNMRRLSIVRRDFLYVLRAVRAGRLDPEQEAIAFARLYDEL